MHMQHGVLPEVFGEGWELEWLEGETLGAQADG